MIDNYSTNLVREIERLRKEIETYQEVSTLFVTALIELVENDCNIEARSTVKTLILKAKTILESDNG